VKASGGIGSIMRLALLVVVVVVMLWLLGRRLLLLLLFCFKLLLLLLLLLLLRVGTSRAPTKLEQVEQVGGAIGSHAVGRRRCRRSRREIHVAAATKGKEKKTRELEFERRSNATQARLRSLRPALAKRLGEM
jgi:hypothetical protein